MDFFTPAMRALQDRHDGRRLADRLNERRVHDAFLDADIAQIAAARFFFLATAADGFVDCSFKGGDPGFVRVVGPSTLEWDDLDGNSMYRSLGNIASGGNVGLLFVPFDGTGLRLRINGRAEVIDDASADGRAIGARALVRVTATHIYPNCPRYIPRMAMDAVSPYVPRAGVETPVPEWKTRDYIVGVLPGTYPEK